MQTTINGTNILLVGNTFPDVVDSRVVFGDRKITFSIPLGKRTGDFPTHELTLTSIQTRDTSAQFGEYHLNKVTDHPEHDVLASFIILVALKWNYRDVLEELHTDESVTPPTPSASSFTTDLRSTAMNMASEFLAEGLGRAPRSVSLFIWATHNHHNTVTQLLLARISIVTTKSSVQSWFSLHDAVLTGNPKVVVLFLIGGRMDVNTLPKCDEITVLQMAASLGNEAVVEMLLKAGADVTQSGTLRAAARGGHEGVVRLILGAGADARGESALYAAARGGHEAVVDILLGAGADACGSGVLGVAARGGHGAVVKQLLQAGANANEWLVLDSAVSGGHEAVVDTLLSAGANANDPGVVLIAAGGGYQGVVDRLLKAGAHANTNGVLHTAVRRGHKAVVEVLLKSGADVHTLGVLSSAAGGGNVELVKILIEAGANVQESEALHAATSAGHEHMVQMLLNAGADVSRRDYRGDTALDHAIRGGHTAMASILRSADVI